jgi:dihydrofolate synthase/folylpolyglutamate synthase
VIEATTRRLGAPLAVVGRDVTCTTAQPTSWGQRFGVVVGRGRDARRFAIEIGLVGAHQQVNAATAVAALATLEQAGLPVARSAVEDGLRRARWPARLERLSVDPPIVVDGAHNPAAIDAVAAALAARYPDRSWRLVLGTSRGKDLEGILSGVLPACAGVVATRSTHPRATPTAELAAAVRRHGVPVREADSPAAALELALASTGADELLLATGSIFLAADVREAWAARGGMAMPPRDPPLPLV